MAQRRSNEFSRIERITRVLSRGAAGGPSVELGIGDDAAVLRVSGRQVWTIDTQVEGVHFDRRWVDLASIGYRSFQAAVSDVAAMGGRPTAALCNLALPKRFSDAELVELAEGQAEASRECDCPVIGGNVSRASELSVTTTVLGQVKAPVLRDGARAGDELWLIGEVGLAGLGLRALAAKARRTVAIRHCVERWRRPRARVEDGPRLTGRARAALDVSDGLAGDAGHLAKASRVRVVVVQAWLEQALPPELSAAARDLGVDAVQAALFGGEDYALLAAGPAERRGRSMRRIGYLERGRGVVLEQPGGKRSRLGAGFDHFSKRHP